MLLEAFFWCNFVSGADSGGLDLARKEGVQFGFVSIFV
jgi:hypothetical protein